MRDEEDSPPGPRSVPVVDDEGPRLLAQIGHSVAWLGMPLYLFGNFYFLRWLEPRALATYSFLVGAPAVVALVLSRGSPQGALRSFASTSLAFLTFSAAIYWAHLEAGLCFVVLLFPMVAIGALVSLVTSAQRFRQVRKSLQRTGPSAMLMACVPLAALLEKATAETLSVDSTTSTVWITAGASEIWDGIVEVRTFSEAEMPRTWLNRLDVPRPVRSALERRGNETVRVGYFENGLRFFEGLKTVRRPEELRLSVVPDASSLIADDAIGHAFSHGYLEIRSVRYRLTPGQKGTDLSLSCSYSLRSSVDWYARLVAELVITEFQEKLLQALRRRLEGDPIPESPLLLAHGP